MTLNIVDTSANNTVTSWDLAFTSGVDGVLAKLTEGAGYIDREFWPTWCQARQASKVRGAYHFARPALGNTPQQEAQYVLAYLPPLQPGDVVALDIEQDPKGLPMPQDVGQWALDWLQTVRAAVGFNPWIYSDLSFLEQYLSPVPALGQFPLWLAAYGSAAPSVPAPWPVMTAWQRTNGATYPGITNTVDASTFYGDQTTWAKLGKPAASRPPAQPKRYVLDVAEKLRALPALFPPLGDLLPEGAQLTAAGGETTNWVQVKTADGRTGWVLKRNTTPYNG